jgi:hypothetical protein
MITNEQWKPIKGFTRYEVSNTGKVRNIHTKKLKAIRIVKIGYCITDLKENEIKKTAYIHRLVAEAFIPNPDNLPQINHKDENKSNNCVDNLEWCTSSYNLSYNGRAKKVGLHHREHSPTKKQIMCIETGEIFRSVSEAARKMNITRICISYVLSGKQKHAGGYSWALV